MTREEEELCARIRETGMKKLAERLDRLSEVTGVPWSRDCLEHSVYAATKAMCEAVYDWIHEVYCEQRAGRDTFRNHGIRVDDLDYAYYGGDVSGNMTLGDGDSRREIKLGGHATCYGGRIAYPSMRWSYKNDNTSTQVLDLLADDLRYVDDLVDFCVRYKAAKGELDGIKVNESLERAAKARHQLELLEKL